MNHKELINSLHQKEMIKFGDFTLKSGVKSPIYVNLREIMSYPPLLKGVSDLMYAAQPIAKPSLICGVPYSAITFATYLSTKHDIPMLLRRKEIKTYGTKQQIEGVFEQGQECLLIEDVVTSGASILETVSDLKAAGVVVKHVIAVLDRQQEGAEALAKEGIQFYPVLKMNEVLDFLYQEGKIPEEFCAVLGYPS